MHGSPDAIDAFIARWSRATGNELANYQLFLTELTELLGLPRPEPAGADARDNAYVFERAVTFRHGDGSTSAGRIDLYRRGAFVCECKRIRGPEAGKGFDDALLRARSQAESYARALPTDEGRPPFLVVVDVGRVIELYAEFSRTGGTYVPFPDPRSHRLPLDSLRDAAVRARLAAVWTDPLSLDPTRRSAKVTREIAARLADVAKSLEAAGHQAEAVAAFLSRCLFTCFAEDIGLLPRDGFRGLLERHAEDPATAMRMVQALWRDMDAGGFSASLAADVLRFNGKLFKTPDVLPLTRDQIALLIDAAKAQWTEVEPAIFGTLLERALDPTERHALGAHYTPRAYVERLVLPTVIDPLREDWSNAKAAALTLAREGALDEALKTVRDFHHELCRVRVLDPACGSGNFLYVTLEHLKRLEGEVLNTFDDLDPTRQSAKQRQQGLALDGDRADPFGGETVDPHQLLGIEVNPRAAAIAEMVLWIGYLQWHYRTRGNVTPPEPVLRDFRNIECRDAVLAWDRIEYVTDDTGRPVTRWDGKTYKPSPITGEPIPDDSARVPVERYVNPRKATWPEAEFVVGNPPFIGGWKIRGAISSGYVEALWATYPHIPQKADYVMYWWDLAAERVCAGQMRRSGLITTNSITQIFQRRVVEQRLAQSGKTSIVFAVPDHPWVDSVDGAQVRIAMTVVASDASKGNLDIVISESFGDSEDAVIVLKRSTGHIQPSLRIGAEVSATRALISNAGICSPGVQLYGTGFLIEREVAESWPSSVNPNTGLPIVRPYKNGRDLLHASRDLLTIDFFGLTETQARSMHPYAFQRVADYVKPERMQNRRDSIRSLWWRFGWERPVMRRALAGLKAFPATVETSTHRIFVLLDHVVLPDNMLTVVALGDPRFLGILMSRLHVCWALATGARLGVGNDSRYSKSRCFEAFPFPDVCHDGCIGVANLAEAIDHHRKRQQAQHSALTLTGIYNVLEKLRRNEPLTAKDKLIHEQGLVSVLRELHDELDRAVFAAYGWDDLAERLVGRPGATTPWPEKPADQAEAEEELLTRLVALNAERAAEEARGLVRWLRPDFQNPAAASTAVTAPDAASAPGTPTAAGTTQPNLALPTPAADPAPARKPGKRRGKPGAATDTATPTAPHGAATTTTTSSTDPDDDTPTDATAPTTIPRQPWPKTAPEQARTIADLLARTRTPLTVDAIAAHYTARGRWRDRLPQLLETLAALGRARRDGDGWRGA
jgi:hypothetical protein